MKKVLIKTIFISSLIFLFAIIPNNRVLAVESGTCGANLSWSLSDDGELTIIGSGDMTNYSSASSVPWYSLRASITSVELDGDITTLSSYAFYDCDSVTNITLPDSITTIGYATFYHCNNLTNVMVSNNLIKIGGYAFRGCNNLTSITIPDSVTSIGASAFLECNGLNSVYITDMQAWFNIDFEGGSANPLQYAENLYLNNELVENFVIPKEITEIKQYTFGGFNGLTNIIIPENITSIGAYAFEWCDNLTGITIPNSVTSIGDYAFSYCKNLTTITIPDSVTSIGKSAFENCYSLTSITLSNNITCIKEDIFNSCYSLTSVNIPISVTNIEKFAFENCTSLTSVIMPNTVNSVGVAAFRGCSNLTSITISDSITNINSALFEDCSSLINITIPESVTSIGNSAFEGCSSLASLDIPNSVTSIGESVFEDCKSLKSITIPNGVTNIEYHTFYYCTGLTNVKIPKSVTSIGNSAFSYCNSLTDVFYMGSEADWNKISKSYAYLEPEQIHYAETTEIYTIVYNANGGNGAPETQSKNEGESIILSMVQPIREGYSFLGWAMISDAKEPEYFSGALFDIDSDTVLYAVWKDINDTTIASGVCGDLTWALDEEGILVISGSGNMGNYSYYPTTAPWYSNRFSIKSIIIDNGVKSIGDYAFYGCGNLTSVTIPDNVVKIGDYAFCCSSLSDIYITDNTYKIAHTAFDGTKWYDSQPDGVVYLGNYVYSYKGEMSVDTSIVLNNAVGIADYAFSDCENLCSLTIGENVKYIGSYAFENCVNLKTVKYNAVNCYYSNGGYSVEEAQQFSGCTELESVIIGDKVIFIPANIFSDCTNIEKVYIGDSVEVIGGAFTNCTNIQEINIPKSVKYIWQYAFPVESQLTDIYYDGTEEEWNNISIKYIVPAAWTINTNTCLQNATKHYNCVPERNLVITSDKYTSDLEIRFSKNNSECFFKITYLTDNFDVDDIRLFVACYGENSQFTGFKECHLIEEDKSRTYTFSLPTSKYKIMLWDNNCCPIIDVIE